jgi:ChaB
MPVPKTSRHSLPPAGELPGTLRRSSEQAQQTFTRALTRAVQASGEGDQAVRTAFAEFKRTFEKRGGHWIPRQASPAGCQRPR